MDDKGIESLHDQVSELYDKAAELKAAYIAYREATTPDNYDTAEMLKRRDRMDELCGYEGSI